MSVIRGVGFICCYCLLLCVLCALCGESPPQWGSDHVGQPVPEYVTGDECLFCHRTDIGPTWGTNRHHSTIREVDPDSPGLAALKQSPFTKDLAGEVKLLLGHDNRQRFLKPSSAYGRVDLLSVEWSPHGDRDGKLLATENPRWDGKQFADACAGCHATGVDPKTRSFAVVGLDCYTCHGLVNLNHSKDTSLVHLSKKRKDPARMVISICAQCHVRTGKSASTGLPYPNNFVAGDNLFRDFKVDLSQEAIARLNPADRHALENVRDVVLLGKEETTCLSCHDVHKRSTKKHHVLASSESCITCHNETGPKKVPKAYEVHSPTCGY